MSDDLFSSAPLEFRPGDFQTIQWFFSVENLTSKQPVEGSHEIEVIEILEHGLSLKFPPKACAAGHQLRINITCQIPSPQGEYDTLTLDSTARVDQIESGDTDDWVQISFVQMDEKSWKQILDSIQKRQTEVLDFFKSVKGEDD